MKEDVFNTVKDTSAFCLPPQGVMVIMKWEWHDQLLGDARYDDPDEIDHVSETSSEDLNPDIDSDFTDDDLTDDGSGSTEDIVTHTVTFKCIGATCDRQYQKALEKVSTLLNNEVTVPVNIFPEVDNPKDTQAIAFKCYLNGNWQTIGYIVREALSSVHSALRDNRIMQVSFAWAKFRSKWPNSGPGYYAGIKITVKGQWPKVVCQYASTR